MKKCIVFVVAVAIGLVSFQSVQCQVFQANNPKTGKHVLPYAWDGKGEYNGGYDACPSTLTTAEADRRSADIMQRTGNWRYMKPYIPYLSEAGVARVESIFRSKGGQPPNRTEKTDQVLCPSANKADVSPHVWNNGNGGVYNGGYKEHPSTLTTAEADRRSADIMQRTGNWGYIEPYIPYLSEEGVARVECIYKSKQEPRKWFKQNK